jgi:hypothetical protein
MLDIFDDWNLGLSVPSTNWCDADDHDGFETLFVDQSEIQHFAASSSVAGAAHSWQQHAASSSGGGVVSFGFAAFGGSHSEGSTSSSFQDSSGATFSNVFRDTAKGLQIELEYGMCNIAKKRQHFPRLAARAPARERRPEIKGRGRRTRSSGGRSTG